MSENTKPAAEAVAEIATEIKTVQTAVAGIDKINAGLAELERLHPRDVIIDGIDKPAGMKAAIAARAAWREPRLAVERVRKEAKAPVLALGRAIDSLAAGLTTKLLAGEQHYDAQIKTEEARKEAEKEAKAKAEAERVKRITIRIGEIAAIAVDYASRGAAELAQHITATEALQIGADFEEFQAKAEATRTEVLAQLRRLHAAAVEREAEAARLAAEREELVRLRAEQEERDRQAAAARAEEERKAAEARAAQEREDDERRAQQQREHEAEMQRQREQREAEQRAHEERLAAERREQEAELARRRAEIEEQERQAAAQRAEADRIAREAREAEERRIAAERAEQERQEREAAEARRREEEARAAAEKRLRDAAPRLLKALRDLVASLVDSDEEGLIEHAPEMVEARAAIAEAEGAAEAVPA